MENEESWAIALVSAIGGLAAGAAGFVVGQTIGEAGSSFLEQQLLMYVVPALLSIGGTTLIYGLRASSKLSYKLMQSVAVLLLSVGIWLGMESGSSQRAQDFADAASFRIQAAHHYQRNLFSLMQQCSQEEMLLKRGRDKLELSPVDLSGFCKSWVTRWQLPPLRP